MVLMIYLPAKCRIDDKYTYEKLFSQSDQSDVILNLNLVARLLRTRMLGERDCCICEISEKGNSLSFKVILTGGNKFKPDQFGLCGVGEGSLLRSFVKLRSLASTFPWITFCGIQCQGYLLW